MNKIYLNLLTFIILFFAIICFYELDLLLHSIILYILFQVINLFILNIKKKNITYLILSALVVFILPWLAVTGIGLSAINEIPNNIIYIGLILYSILYTISWYYFLIKKPNITKSKLIGLVILNVFNSILILYLITEVLFKNYF